MLAEIRNQIILQLTAAFPGVNVYNSRVSPIDVDLTPALNVHTKSGVAAVSASEDNYATNVRVTILIYLAGDDKPDGSIEGGEELHTLVDEWITNVRNVFLTRKNTLNKTVHRFNYTGFDIQYPPDMEKVVAMVALSYDAYYREVIPES